MTDNTDVQESQGTGTDAAPGKWREESTVGPYDSLRACLARMNGAGIPIFEQNAYVANALDDLARKASEWHTIYGGKR